MGSRLLALFAVAAWTACSSGGGSTDAGSSPTISTFTATPNTLPTAGGFVALAWAVTGATSLSIDHGVGTVTPVTSGTMSVQVTATTTFTLTATDTTGSSTQTAVVTVTAPITVAGGVTDEVGSPLANATVLITSGAFSQSTVSDANGAFSVPNVPVPYNATVIDSAKKLAIQYQGLTRTDPTLFDLTTTTLQRCRPHRPAQRGDLSSHRRLRSQCRVRLGANNAAKQRLVRGLGRRCGRQRPLGWPFQHDGHPLRPGAPRGRRLRTSLDYPGYGTLSGVLLEDMSVLGGQNVTLDAVAPSLLSGSITTATGFSLVGKEMFFIPAAGAIFTLLNDADAGSTFSYVTPNVTGATFTLVAEAAGPSSQTALVKMTGLAANASGLALNIPASPTITLPVNAATGVTVTTPFSWTNFTGVYLVVFSGSPAYVVFTADSTVTIPDFTAQGLPLPASSNYTWEVLGIGPSTTVDSVAVPGGLIGLELLQDGYFTTSEERFFTTGP